MATVTALTVQVKDNKRCNLFLDGEFYCGLQTETAVKFGLKKGLTIDEKKLKEIIDDNDRSVALSKALSYSENTPKTRKQIKTYLKGKGFSENVVFFVSEKLKEYGLIDDVEFAVKYIESCAGKQGRRLTEYRLMQKGVCKPDIEKAYLSVEVSYKESASALVEKRLKGKTLTKELLAKTYRYLIGKGFSYEEAENAVEKYKADD